MAAQGIWVAIIYRGAGFGAGNARDSQKGVIPARDVGSGGIAGCEEVRTAEVWAWRLRAVCRR